MRRLIIITGFSAAGKSTLARKLEFEGWGSVVNLGDLVWATVCNAGFRPKSRIEAGILFVCKFDSKALASRIRLKMHGCRGGIIIDGLRLPQTLEAIDHWVPSLIHLHVSTPFEVVAERLNARCGTEVSADPFADEIRYLAKRADFFVPGTGQIGMSASTILGRS